MKQHKKTNALPALDKYAVISLRCAELPGTVARELLRDFSQSYQEKNVNAFNINEM